MAADGVIRSKPRYGLSIETGTPKVPDDERYHVVADGEVVFSTKVLAAAEVFYEELEAERASQSRAQLAREQAHFSADAVLAGSYQQRAAKAKRSGGKGGSGGV